MAFTNFVPPLLTREQSGTMPDIISHLLGGYSKGMHAAYLPQQIEADIFSKKISPLATLATSPMFLQNPQFQAALGNLLSKNLTGMGMGMGMGGLGHGFEGSFGNTDTYAGQIGRDINEAEEQSKALTKGGKLGTGIAGAGGALENYLGDFGKYITSALGLNTELAQKENQFQDNLKRLKKTAIDTQLLSARDAEDIFTQRKNETAEQTLARVKKRAPSLFQQNKSNSEGQMGLEDQREFDNKLLAQANAVSEQIQKKTGIYMNEMAIFEYMKKHPGKIHFPSLKKYVLGEL